MEQEDFIIENRCADAADCIARFRHPEVFGDACRACPGYGRSWICPPLDGALARRLCSFMHISVYRLRVRTDNPERFLAGSARLRAEEMLLEEERRLDGLAFGFTGRCPRCRECTRVSGAPCRFPDKARPSLEALGFDVSALQKTLFGEPLRWGKGSYSFVGALFHNAGR